MLTAEQRTEFDERGFLRLRGVFSSAEAAAMEAHVWATLGRKHGVDGDDPDTWEIPLAAGLRSLRRHPVFQPIGGPALIGALDELIGARRWERPRDWGQFLVSFPTATGGHAPSRAIWHTDFPYFLPADRVVGALVFSFVGAVPANTGGTLVIGGSPRLIGGFLARKPQLRTARMKVTRKALMASDPWLRSLQSEPGEEDWRERVLTAEHRIEDVAVEVAELTGEPGDVVIGHPWLLHTPTPNHGDRPRFALVQRIRSATDR